MLEMILLVLQLVVATFFFFLVIAFVTGAPFVPTVSPAVKKALKLANVGKGKTLYDLGSGDGRVLFAAAGMGARAVGYEINPLLVLWTNLRARLKGIRTVHTKWANFWNADIADADIVFIYLMPWRMKQLEKKLASELKPGTLIASNSFVFPNLPIVAKDEKLHLYIFRIPARS